MIDFGWQSSVTMATAQQGDVSITMEQPGPLTVLQVLSMNVEELRLELQARNLTLLGTAKPDLQQALLAAVTLHPPVQPSPVATTPGAATGLAARPRTSSGQSNSAVDVQLQLRRLEVEEKCLEIAERQRQQDLEAAERKYKIDAAERQGHLELEAEEKKRAHELEMKRLELAAQSGTASADDRRQAPAFLGNSI